MPSLLDDTENMLLRQEWLQKLTSFNHRCVFIGLVYNEFHFNLLIVSENYTETKKLYKMTLPKVTKRSLTYKAHTGCLLFRIK